MADLGICYGGPGIFKPTLYEDLVEDMCPELS